jgi:phage-related holin
MYIVVPIFWGFLFAFLESLLISVLIKIWLYLTDVILDGTCTSISSWHMLLKYSHRLLILVLMVLTSIKVFTASNISDFKFIISGFFQR